MWCWRRLESPLNYKEINQSILKEMNPEYSLEGLILKLKLHYFGLWCTQKSHWKSPWCWKRWRASEDEMAGRYHQCNEHELRQILGDSEGQWHLACCSPWGRKELDMTGWLNNNRAGNGTLTSQLFLIHQLVFFPDIKLGKKMFSLCKNYQVNKTKGAEQYLWRSTSLGTIALW